MSKPAELLERTIVCCLLALMFVACATKKEESSVVQPAPVVFTIDAPDGTYTSITHAELQAEFGNQSALHLTFGGSRPEGNRWSVLAQLNLMDLTNGSGTVELTAGQIHEGFGLVQKNGPGTGLVNAANGTLTFTFSRTALNGTVNAEGDFRASFRGELGVLCLIPQAELPQGQDAGGLGANTLGPGEVLAVDEQMSSPKCQPLQRLR